MDHSLTRVITLLARKSQGCISELLTPYNLTAAEQPFFMALHHNNGITQEGLTALVGVDKAATARAVKSLEEKGFLIREEDKNDRRNNLLFSTDKAKELYPSVKEALLTLNSSITSGISEKEQEEIYHYLKIMEQNFSMICNEKKGKKQYDSKK